MDNILKDTTSTTIYNDTYQLYIDTTTEINSKTYGTFMTEYDPLDKDLFLIKVKALKDIKLKRDPTDGSKRYLHSINKTKKAEIMNLRKLFNFVIDLDGGDTRTYLLDKPEIKIIDYSDKSVAIFSTHVPTLSKLTEMNGKGLRYNSGLTGPGMVRASGYLLFKSSPNYAKILEELSDGTLATKDMKVPMDLPPKVDIPKVINLMQNIAPGPKNELRFRITGTETYIKSKLEEIKEDYGDRIKVLTDKTLEDDRKEMEIEILSDD